jgi:hypothetical protein
MLTLPRLGGHGFVDVGHPLDTVVIHAHYENDGGVQLLRRARTPLLSNFPLLICMIT